MISPISSLSPLIFNETSYLLKDVCFADQVKLMPVNERVIIIIYGFEVEGRKLLNRDFFIFWWDGGKFSNFGDQAAKQEFQFYFRLITGENSGEFKA